MKVLVTGSNGFIGSHLANKLVDLGHEVMGVDNLSHISSNEKKFKYETMDFRQFVQQREMDFDVIYHLAADINVDESILFPERYMWNNAWGTLMMLEHLRKIEFKGKIVYASSAEVYGTAQGAVMNEDHPLNPLSPYAVSKLTAEQLCKNYAQLYGLNVTVVRNFNTFGEYQRGGMYGGVIAKFKAQAKAQQQITVYGSGEQMRDYMHISQAVNGYILAMEANLPTIVNFGSGKPIKIIDIANFIAKKYGVDVIHLAARPNEIMRLEADVSRAQQYGYKVETDFWTHLDSYVDSDC